MLLACQSTVDCSSHSLTRNKQPHLTSATLCYEALRPATFRHYKADRIALQVPRRPDATAWQTARATPQATNLVQDGSRHIPSPAKINISCHIKPSNCTQHLRPSDISLLAQPTSRTNFAGCSFRLSAPAVWNSLLKAVLDSPSLKSFQDLPLSRSLQ